jgi:hypothetical protein
MPDPNDLTTLAIAKEYMRVSGIVEDTFIDRLITQSTAQIEQYLRRKVKERVNLIEFYDGTGTSHLILREFPITDLLEVNIDPLQTFGTATEVDVTQFIVRSDAEGRISISPIGSNTSARFPIGVKNVKVRYSAGFAAIPVNIQLACNKLVAVHFAKAREGADGIAAESLGGHAITWVDGLPADIVEMLREFRRTV